YRLGDHRLLCGDSSDRHNWQRLMGSLKSALVVTSPPYNQQLDKFKPSGMQKESPAWVSRMAGSYADSMPEPQYQKWQVELFTMLCEFLKADASLFYNHKIRYRNKAIIHPIDFVSKFPYRIRQEIVWARPGSITLNARMFMPRDERIYWLTVSDKFTFNNSTEIKTLSSVWDIIPKVDVPVSAPFPVEIPLRCIRSCSLPADIVVDPFIGSGTTVVAAEQLGRSCYGMEIDPGYCDVAVSRWEKLTGRKARKHGSKAKRRKAKTRT
ncbi:hypothetical protein LCGC14_3010840, partial [marine sediment metagenome]